MSNDKLHDPLPDKRPGRRTMSDEECKRILCSDGELYTDEEVRAIKELLTDWAKTHVEQLLKNDANEESSSDGSCIER